MIFGENSEVGAFRSSGSDEVSSSGEVVGVEGLQGEYQWVDVEIRVI